VQVGADPWVLPGTLSIPAGAGRFPAVVMVHGSGPHDRDETVGGTKVFRDLAWGLASRGIAVLRYEKRTKTHGAKMGGDVTLDSEVIVDALAGLELVRSHASVDPEHVYVLGHSLGAVLAPEIARRDGRLAGAMMLAGNARPIDVVMVAQLEYLAGLPLNAAPEAQAQLGAALAQVRRLASREAAGSELVLGAPAAYFYALADRDDIAEALRVDAPLLLLQGERDYQVTMEDFELWRSALKERPATSFRSFPSLNHLFVTGSGRSTPVEYARPGFVAEDVIVTIHDWITVH
jgi:dienelactone hydrolase